MIPAFIQMPGGMEMVVIVAVLLLLFGKRLPDVSRALGRSVVEFRRGLSGLEDEVRRLPEDAGPKARPTPPAGHDQMQSEKSPPASGSKPSAG